mgnify:CR=1 FL=1
MEQNVNLGSRIAIALLLVSFVITEAFAQDLFIFRDGSEREAKVLMVTNDNTVIQIGKRQEFLPNSSLYMIKYEKRGNVFFTDEGKHFSGEGNGKIPSSADAIYLLEGGEVVAYNVLINGGNVTYANSKKKGSPVQEVSSDAVFLIKYHDGTKDIINDFESVRRKAAEAQAEKQRMEEARLAAIRNQYPKNAVITTKRGIGIKASILMENDEYVTYKKTTLKSSPVFNIDRDKIKKITFN